MAFIEEHQYSIWEEGWKQPKPPMNVLVACEESQAVCKAFRARGHNAFSCDIQECSGGHPEWHICGDALELIQPTFRFYEHGEVTDRWIQFRTQDGEVHENRFWDLIIAHPPCTYLTSSGACRLINSEHEVKDEERLQKGKEAADFFMSLWQSDCEKIAIENPTPIKLFNLPDCTQIIDPYQFGDPWRKRTCLWLKGLPQLLPTKIVRPKGLWVLKSHVYDYELQPKRTAKDRSKTFPGIAAAMAQQWG